MQYDGDYFDAVYAEGDGDPWGFWDSEYEARKFDRTLAALRDRRAGDDLRRVLDLGCGNGAKTARVTEAAPDAQVVGVDLSAEALATARERAPEATYEEADVVDYVAETDREFDAVLAVESLHYLGADRTVTELLAFVEALRAVLADDGLLIATHLRMPRGAGPTFAQARSTDVLHEILETAFETVGRDRYVERKLTALDPDEPEEQPYEVVTMRPKRSGGE